jgi:hypothetical protein
MFHDRLFKIVRNCAEGYGNCIIKQTPNHIIFEFYNAGWSTYEEADSELQRMVMPTIKDHPMSVYIFNTKYLDEKSYAGLNAEKIKSYIYKLKKD